MSINYDQLGNAPRLLLEAELKPLQGDRFQPTGFADLGAARYKAPSKTDMLLVESAQSVANRLEMTIWDEAREDLIETLSGLPYICVLNPDGSILTNSILEAHRINSEYILKLGGNASGFHKKLQDEIGFEKDKPVDAKRFLKTIFKYDPNSILHGSFLEEIGGRLRITRAVSGFIEATDIETVESGGVKNNRVQPDLKGGEGNVPFHRTEFIAKSIVAYFNLDLALLRGYGLPDEATKLLIALALFKIRRFLSTGLRLRTACDLDLVGDVKVTRPDGFALPSETDLLAESQSRVEACGKVDGLFGEPAITEVKWEKAK